MGTGNSTHSKSVQDMTNNTNQTASSYCNIPSTCQIATATGDTINSIDVSANGTVNIGSNSSSSSFSCSSDQVLSQLLQAQLKSKNVSAATGAGFLNFSNASSKQNTVNNITQTITAQCGGLLPATGGGCTASTAQNASIINSAIGSITDAGGTVNLGSNAANTNTICVIGQAEKALDKMQEAAKNVAKAGMNLDILFAVIGIIIVALILFAPQVLSSLKGGELDAAKPVKLISRTACVKSCKPLLELHGGRVRPSHVKRQLKRVSFLSPEDASMIELA